MSTVVKVPDTMCQDGGVHRLPLPSGYISSTRPSPCPLEIRVPPGQHVNLTLLDFSSSSHPNVTSAKASQNTKVPPRRPGLVGDDELVEGGKVLQFCQQYALVEEPLLSSSVTLCGGGVRAKQVYLSRTNVIHIQLFTPTTATFLIKYEGTPHHPHPPPTPTQPRPPLRHIPRSHSQYTPSCLASAYINAPIAVYNIE